MDMEKATPQQISDYKLAWRSNAHAVRLHSDLDVRGKDWCRKNLERHQWSMTTWTNVYEHTFLFEHESDAQEFASLWPEFTNQ